MLNTLELKYSTLSPPLRDDLYKLLLQHYIKLYNLPSDIIYPTTDAAVFSTLLTTNTQFIVRYNMYITLKNMIDFIDFTANINIYEEALLTDMKLNAVGRQLWIVENISELLTSIINEYVYSVLDITYTEIPQWGVNIQKIKLHTHINKNFLVAAYMKKHKINEENEILLQEIYEDYTYNIKMTTLHRIKCFDIINNCKKIKKIDADVQNTIKFTNGNTVIIPSTIIKNLKSLKIINKIPGFIP